MNKLEELKAAYDKAFLIADGLYHDAWYVEHDQRGFGAVDAWDAYVADVAYADAYAAYAAAYDATYDTAYDAAYAAYDVYDVYGAYLEELKKQEAANDLASIKCL